jgi:hypothetical protein
VHNTEPVQQFVSVFDNLVPGWLALTLAVVLVVISQIKINVTNAYSGSLAWTSAWTRTTKRYPGRIIFVVVNLAIALALMEGDMFSACRGSSAFTPTSPSPGSWWWRPTSPLIKACSSWRGAAGVSSRHDLQR